MCSVPFGNLKNFCSNEINNTCNLLRTTKLPFTHRSASKMVTSTGSTTYWQNKMRILFEIISRHDKHPHTNETIVSRRIYTGFEWCARARGNVLLGIKIICERVMPYSPLRFTFCNIFRCNVPSLHFPMVWGNNCVRHARVQCVQCTMPMWNRMSSTQFISASRFLGAEVTVHFQCPSSSMLPHKHALTLVR